MPFSLSSLLSLSVHCWILGSDDVDVMGVEWTGGYPHLQ